MGATDERRVRSLRLRAAKADLVQRGALLLEDALRTASMPDPGRGRVLFIRSLELGVIRADSSPSSVALALEHRVRSLASDAVHAEADGAEGAPAVYFADAVQALVALATRLARQEVPRAWFWPLVAPKAWGRPRDEALRLVLDAALETEQGPAGAVALVRELETRGAAGPLLGALRWQEGPALLRAFWGYAPQVDRGVLIARAPSAELEALPRRRRALLEAWVGTWGPGDARSLWLAAVMLSMDRLARVAEPELLAKAMRMVAAVGVEQRVRRAPPAPDGEAAARPVSRAERPEESSVPGKRPPGAEEPAPVEARQARPEEAPPVETRAAKEEVPGEEPRPRKVPAVRGEAAEPGAPEEPERTPTPDEWMESPEPTQAGGLLFLVHVLGYLGLPEILAARPELVERSVAEHFLALVANRLGVPPWDPVLRALRVRQLPSLSGPLAFEFPESFRRKAGAAAPVREVQLAGGRTLELDARGRMALAVRYAEPGAVSAVSGLPDASTAGGALGPGAAGGSRGVGSSSASWHAAADLALLLRTLHISAARVLRAQAQLSLRALVLRPARVASTPTHLDVLFDHRQADLRIRRAGLDIDPGWVPWIGRVIRYHYLHGELPQA